ncbi:MAG: hypothetical protein LWW98_10830, partial [Deltaproteobacteria bacterium]|nr:hypothetical protein [Deltaproteobacteria bacterium]
FFPGTVDPLRIFRNPFLILGAFVASVVVVTATGILMTPCLLFIDRHKRNYKSRKISTTWHFSLTNAQKEERLRC